MILWKLKILRIAKMREISKLQKITRKSPLKSHRGDFLQVWKLALQTFKRKTKNKEDSRDFCRIWHRRPELDWGTTKDPGLVWDERGDKNRHDGGVLIHLLHFYLKSKLWSQRTVLHIQGYFSFRGAKDSEPIFDLTRANLEANSVDYFNLTQNFGQSF